MKISDYELDFDSIIDEINDKKYQVIGLFVIHSLKNQEI